jgi:hypothetical protein
VLGSLNLIFHVIHDAGLAAQPYLLSTKHAVSDIENRWTAANRARGKTY